MNKQVLNRLKEYADQIDSIDSTPPTVKVIDPVNHPPHYSALPATCAECDKPIECIDVVRHMNFNRGNSVKYIWRAGEKDPNTTIQDLEKAIWYLQDEVERLKNT